MNAIRMLIVLIVAGLSNGCSKEKINELVSQAKESATSVAADVSDGVKSTADEAVSKAQSIAETTGNVTGVGDISGTATMTLDAPTEFAACYVQLITINEGRPSVLKIASSRNGDDSTFPAFLLQANVSDRQLAALNGRSIPARLFAQRESGGPIWYSPDDKPVSVAVRVTDGKVTASLQDASVLISDSEAATTVSGSFQCVAHPE